MGDDVLTVEERELVDSPMAAPLRPLIDRLVSRVEAAEAERDEATHDLRAEIKYLQAERDALARGAVMSMVERDALRARVERLRGELTNIRDAKPETWTDYPATDRAGEFRLWAQNRVRSALKENEG